MLRLLRERGVYARLRLFGNLSISAQNKIHWQNWWTTHTLELDRKITILIFLPEFLEHFWNQAEELGTKTKNDSKILCPHRSIPGMKSSSQNVETTPGTVCTLTRWEWNYLKIFVTSNYWPGPEIPLVECQWLLKTFKKLHNSDVYN